MRAPPPEVMAYLDALPAGQRAALRDLRRTVLSAAPQARERIHYGMPSFHLEGPLVSMAAFRRHCSLFAGHAGAGMARGHPGVTVESSTIRFTPDEPLPKGLVKRIVRARLRENRAKAKAGRAGRRPSPAAAPARRRRMAPPMPSPSPANPSRRRCAASRTLSPAPA